MLTFIILLIISILINLDQLLMMLDSYAVELLIKLDLTRLLSEDVRWKILQEYLNNLTITTALLGQNYETTFQDISNVHNSFILGNMRYGMFFIIIIFYLFLKITSQLNKISSMLILFFLLRSFSDTILFSGSSYDFLLFAYLFKKNYSKM